MAFRTVASYIYKARQSFVLQRGVPSDIQPVIGKRKWKEPGGKTVGEARSKVPAFLARTDREIAVARGEVNLPMDELIERFSYIEDPEVRDLYLTGAEEDERLTQSQRDRFVSLITGKEEPRTLLTAADLIYEAKKLKNPAERTLSAWKRELDEFLEFTGNTSPTSCTKDQAIAYRSQLLVRLRANTTKTKLAYLGGLWSILEEIHGSEHIFKGLSKRIKVEKKTKDEELLPIVKWAETRYIDIFKALYYSGCRLAEIAGINAEDIKEDRLIIRATADRSLKSQSSNREIPLHSKLQPIIAPYRQCVGLVWPQLSDKGGRWGTNLSAPCKQSTGVTPHALRHRAATRLREAGFNEAVIGKLLGHTPNNVTGTYGSIPWSRMVEAIESL